MNCTLFRFSLNEGTVNLELDLSKATLENVIETRGGVVKIFSDEIGKPIVEKVCEAVKKELNITLNKTILKFGEADGIFAVSDFSNTELVDKSSVYIEIY